VDSSGNIYDGDDIIFLFAQEYINGKTPVVVGTIHTNGAYERKLAENNIKLIRAPVGDRHVLEEMFKANSVLGGEQSGHIILLNNSTTGDGLLTAIKLCEQFADSNPFEIVNIKKDIQVNINIKITDKEKAEKIVSSEIFTQQIENIKENLGGRVHVRLSGTEPVIRILCEGKDKNKTDEAAEKIKNLLTEGLK
jgi:phosphoglucosamine mutase